MIRKTRTLTDKPFGVGVVLAFPHAENIKAILDEKVAVLQISWGECSKELVLEAHRAGVKLVPQVSVFFTYFCFGKTSLTRPSITGFAIIISNYQNFQCLYSIFQPLLMVTGTCAKGLG